MGPFPQDPKGIPKKYLGEETEQAPALSTPEPERRVGDPANPVEDFAGLAKGIWTGVSDVAQGYADLFQDPAKLKEWHKGWDDLRTGKYHKEIGGQLWKGLKEDIASHWTDPEGNVDLGYTLWHHPASALMDLAIVKDLAAGTAKTGAKLAGGASRLGMTAAEVAKLGPLTKADKFLKIGENIGKIPLDPFQLAGKAAGATPVGKWIKEELGFGPRTPDISRLSAEVSAEVEKEHFMKAKLLMDAKWGEGTGERLFNALGRGNAADFAALTPQDERLMQAYWGTQGLPSNLPSEATAGLPKRESYLKARAILGEDTDKVLALQAGLTEWGPDAWKVPEAMQKDRMAYAVEKIKSGEWSPTYYHLATEQDHEYSLLENFMKDIRGETHGPGRQSGGTGFLEHRTGQGKYINAQDPLGTMLRQVQMEAKFDKKVRFFDRVLHRLQEWGDIRIIPADVDPPKGFAIVPHEVWKKYMLVERRAGGLAYAEAMKGADTTTAARNAYGQLSLDPKMMADIADPKKVIAVPKYVANYLKFKLALPGPLARGYDKYIGYWKGLATVLRPTFWFNEAGGNGFLAALHGVGPEDAIRYWKNRKLLPPELSTIPQLASPIVGSGRYQKVVSTLRGWDNMLNQHMKAGPGFAHSSELIRREVQQTYRTLAKAGQNFFLAADVLDDPEKFYQLMAQSPEKLSGAVQHHVALREQIASRAQEIVRLGNEAVEARQVYNDLWHNANKNGPVLWNQIPTGVQAQISAASGKAVDLENAVAGLKEDYMKRAIQEGAVRASLPELQRIADWSEKAIEATNRLGGGFSRMHPLERQWMTRAVPFYAWTKSMTKLTFMLPFIYPKTTFMWNRWSAMMQDFTSREQQMPEYLQGALHVGVTSDGCDVYVKPIWNAFSGQQPGRLGTLTMPGIAADVLKQHPVFKVLHDLSGGIDSFTMKPWSLNEKMTRTDTGEVYELDLKTGMWRRSIAQPTMWRRLWALFPLSQMIDSAFLSHVQTDKGMTGDPHPVQRGGEAAYPVPAYQRFLKTVAPVFFQDQEMKDAGEVKQSKLYKKYIADIRRMPEDEQDVAMQVLDDAFSSRRGPYAPAPRSVSLRSAPVKTGSR